MTFLFTDVEGSTRLWEDHPAEVQVALELHDQVLRSAIEASDGYVFSTAEDAFVAAFARADDAVGARVPHKRVSLLLRGRLPRAARRAAIEFAALRERRLASPA